MSLLAAMLCLTGLGGCSGAGKAGTAEVVTGSASNIEGKARTAVVPTGSIEVTIGEPVRKISAQDSRDLQARTAPKGSTFLPVHWKYDTSPAPLSGALSGRPQETDVRLSVGGQERPLGSPYTVAGPAIATVPVTTFYVVVPGEPSPSEVDLVVGYDGATQHVDELGRATGAGAGLAQTVNQNFSVVRCPTGGWDTDGPARGEIICDELRTATSRYWPGHGWAPGNERWRVLRVPRLGVERIESDGARYQVETISGAVAGQEIVGHTYPNSVDGTVVLRQSDSALLEVRATGRLTDGSGAPLVDLTARREVSLPG